MRVFFILLVLVSCSKKVQPKSKYMSLSKADSTDLALGEKDLIKMKQLNKK
jgi:hypothetical protein